MKTITDTKSDVFYKFKSNNSCLTINDYVAIEMGKQLELQGGEFYNDTNMLLCITKGRLLIRHGNCEFLLTENEMIILRKDILIEYEVPSNQDFTISLEYVFFSFSDDVVKEFTKLSVLPSMEKKKDSYILVKSFDLKLVRYIDSLKPYFIEPDSTEVNFVKIKLFELLFYLSMWEQEVFDILLDLKISYKSNIVKTVEENIMNSISINQIAALTGRSLSGFRRDFLSVYNMPPSQWIRYKRLEKAKELLLSTKMSITEICYNLGFENIAHFSRLFKIQFSQTPTEYRMNKVAI
ncbi:helix-turn-helix transcriptional regulator [Flavobacterium sp. ANB]|uniref:helix-turn-helix domain-containing protein n=1 Tax=Flavobacterium sp. ANB TaxID=2783790 RepID=UPI00188CA38F|nr:AraC family transcriptional regulator [Flavobacterium sp. ANB]MBF4519163.1 helix-turn-helix transcriptional regulator [Flavobacterium sp. ANB]